MFREFRMTSPQYLIYTPRLPNCPTSKHKTLGEAALALSANLLIGETGFIIHKNEVVLVVTKTNTLIQTTLPITPIPVLSPSPVNPTYLAIPWRTTYCISIMNHVANHP